MWIYKGPWPIPEPLPSAPKNDWAHVYVIGFQSRTKIGISTEPEKRVASLSWEHFKIANENVLQVAITLPHVAASEIEARILKISEKRLKGEYLQEPFEKVLEMVETQARSINNAAQAWLGGKRPQRPKIYRVAKPYPMWMVMWTRDAPPLNGRRPRQRKCFVDEQEARQYLAQMESMWNTSEINVYYDALAARRRLEGHNITLTQLAENWLASHP